MKKFEHGDTFKSFICPNPFVYAELHHNGEIGTCCYISSKFGNLKNKSLKDIWNGDSFKKLRRSILDGEYTYCDSSKCASMQQVLQPQRVTFNYQIPYQLIRRSNANNSIVSKYIKKHESNSSLPEILSLEDDDSCNLSCPSCRIELHVLNTANSKRKLQAQIDLLNSMGNDFKELWLCGAGDPFAAKSYNELLSNFDFNKFPQLKIRLDSNGMLFNKSTWDKTLKNVHEKIDIIAISVDAATKETYELIRRGGNFDTLVKNLWFLSNLRKKGFNFSFIIRMIVQKKNFTEMKKFVELGFALGVDSVVFSVIQNWGTFSTQEYIKQAVHLKENEFYPDLCNLLKNEMFNSTKIDLGNLTQLHYDLNHAK
jgi:MoaA/NifB/PqqE/SkfB family radical SAM enzyme